MQITVIDATAWALLRDNRPNRAHFYYVGNELCHGFGYGRAAGSGMGNGYGVGGDGRHSQGFVTQGTVTGRWTSS